MSKRLVHPYTHLHSLARPTLRFFICARFYIINRTEPNNHTVIKCRLLYGMVHIYRSFCWCRYSRICACAPFIIIFLCPAMMAEAGTQQRRRRGCRNLLASPDGWCASSCVCLRKMCLRKTRSTEAFVRARDSGLRRCCSINYILLSAGFLIRNQYHANWYKPIMLPLWVT